MQKLTKRFTPFMSFNYFLCNFRLLDLNKIVCNYSCLLPSAGLELAQSVPLEVVGLLGVEEDEFQLMSSADMTIQISSFMVCYDDYCFRKQYSCPSSI